LGFERFSASFESAFINNFLPLVACFAVDTGTGTGGDNKINGLLLAFSIDVPGITCACSSSSSGSGSGRGRGLGLVSLRSRG